MPKGRDTKTTRTFHVGTATGRRFVDRGKVRIEWREGGRRRQRTIGKDNEETRREADAQLTAILEGLDREESSPSPSSSSSLVERDLREVALRLLDLADGLADGLRARLSNPGTPTDAD